MPTSMPVLATCWHRWWASCCCEDEAARNGASNGIAQLPLLTAAAIARYMRGTAAAEGNWQHGQLPGPEVLHEGGPRCQRHWQPAVCFGSEAASSNARRRSHCSLYVSIGGGGIGSIAAPPAPNARHVASIRCKLAAMLSRSNAANVANAR